VHSVISQCHPDDQIVVLNDEAGTDVVFRWELTRYRLRGGYLGWEGRLDAERLRDRTGQVWLLSLGEDTSRLKNVHELLLRGPRTWLLANHVPYTVIPTKKRDPIMRCDVYRWVSATGNAAAVVQAQPLSCWP
jgi:hypothetical protein